MLIATARNPMEGRANLGSQLTMKKQTRVVARIRKTMGQESRRQRAEVRKAEGGTRIAKLETLCLRRQRKLARDQFPQVELAAGVINVDSGQISFRIVVQDDPCRDFAAFDTRFLREVDVERIGLWKIIEFHGRNPRSRNALWMVSLSESVTTTSDEGFAAWFFPTVRVSWSESAIQKSVAIQSQISKERTHQQFKPREIWSALLNIAKKIADLICNSCGEFVAAVDGNRFALQGRRQVSTNIFEDEKDQGFRSILRQPVKFSAERFQLFLAKSAR